MTIKNNVMGKKITRIYEIKAKRDDEGLLTDKPKLQSSDSVEWVKIISFDGTNIRTNNNNNYSINIDDEEVTVSNEVFEAKTNEMILYTTKELEIIEPNKSESDQTLDKMICEYNKQEIEKDKKLSAYCTLHNLLPSCTDVDELRRVVYFESLSPHLEQNTVYWGLPNDIYNMCNMGYSRMPISFNLNRSTLTSNSLAVL